MQKSNHHASPFRERTPLSNANEADKIAVELLELILGRMTSAKFDAAEIEKSVAHLEASPQHKVDLPKADSSVSQTNVAAFETALRSFHWYLPFDKAARSSEELDHAKSLAEKVDNYRKTDYWLPLTEYLGDSTVEQRRAWQAARYAHLEAQRALHQGDFASVKDNAIYGYQKLSDAPDERLFLNLSARVQSALALGDKAINLAVFLGQWLFNKGKKIGFHMLSANVAYNMGDQLILNGRFDEANHWLIETEKVATSWPNIRKIGYYKTFALERKAVVARRRRDLTKARKLLEQFKKEVDAAKNEKWGNEKKAEILYYQGLGLIYEEDKKHDKAEAAFHQAHSLASAKPTNGQSKYEDAYNAWAAKTALACNSLLARQDSAKTLKHLEDAVDVGSQIPGFLNADRRCTVEIYRAEAFMNNGNDSDAEACLQRAEELLEAVDSPRLTARKRITDAQFLINRGEKAESDQRFDEAEQISAEHGIYNYLEMIKGLRNTDQSS